MTIEWIDRNVRVPNDRRKVLVWGISAFILDPRNPPLKFLGVSRHNFYSSPFASQDAGRFDVEKGHSHYTRVTHWAEITGPEKEQSS